MDQYNVNPERASEMLKALIQLNRANAEQNKSRRGIMMWGAIGIGKSSILRQVADELGYNVIDERLSQIDPSDIRGVPVPFKVGDEEVKVDWAIPSHFPREGCEDTILFLDELPNANPSVQQAAYQLVLDGEIGQYKLPSNVVVVAAGNRESDKGAVHRMPAPLVNRFVHIEMETTFDDWFTYAINNDFHPLVVSFLQRFKDQLFNFNPKNCSRGFGTPRSWEAVSEILHLNNVDNEVKEDLIIGAVGLEAGSQFNAFSSIASNLPDIEKVMKGKVTKLENDNEEDSIGLNFTAMNMIAMELRRNAQHENYETYFENAFKFVSNNMNLEMTTVYVTTIINRMELAPIVSGAFGEWLKENSNVINIASNV